MADAEDVIGSECEHVFQASWSLRAVIPRSSMHRVALFAAAAVLHEIATKLENESFSDWDDSIRVRVSDAVDIVRSGPEDRILSATEELIGLVLHPAATH